MELMDDIPYVSLQGVSYAPRKRQILSDVCLTLRRGEFVSIVGPSGSGKSTLLKILAGLVKPDAGEIIVANNVVRGPSARRNLMFQKPTLLPWLNVYDNVALGLKFATNDNKLHFQELIRDTLRQVGLSRHEQSPVQELSGGEQQRVALARSLVLLPELLMLDEPFSALDIISKEMLQYDLKQIVSSRNITTILVSHFLEEAIQLSDRVLLLSPRQGKIVEQITISESAYERTSEVIQKYLRDIESRFREVAVLYDEHI